MSRIKSCNVNFGESLIVGEISDIELKKQEEAAKIEGLALPILKKAQGEAQDIIQRARGEAEAIVQAANEQKAQIEAGIEDFKNEIIENASREGNEKGRQEAFAQMQEKLNAVDAFCGSEFEIKNKIMESAKTDMLNLCLKICESVCSLSLNPEILEKIINKALLLLETKSQVNVIVGPVLGEQLDDGFEKNFNNVKIIVNQKIADNAIIVESLGGNVDCSVKSQIEKIASEFLNVK